jgi:recombination protein RecT
MESIMSNNQELVDLQVSEVFRAVDQAETGFNDVASAFGKLSFKAEAEFARQALNLSLSAPADKARYALFNCTPESIYYAVAQVSSIGLSLNPKLQHAHLIPRFNPVSKRLECCLDFGYRGIIKLGTDSQAITHVTVTSVYPWEMAEGGFKWNGPSAMPDFGNINILDPRREKTPSGAAICISHLVSGGVQVTIMTRAELDAAKDMSFSPSHFKWGEQMEFKSVIKRASKLWPMTSADSRVQEAIDVLNQTGAKYNSKEIVQADPEATKPKRIAQNPMALLTQQLKQLKQPLH